MKNRKNNPFFRTSAAVFASIVLSGSSAHAVSNSWAANASNTWATAASWTGGVNIPGSTTADNTDVATFSFTLATSGKVVTVDTTRFIGGITFGNTSTLGYTLSGGSLRLNSGGVIQSTGTVGAHTDTISTPIQISGTIAATAAFNSSPTTAANGVISISGGVTGSATAANTTTLTLGGTGTGANTISGVIGNGAGGGTLALSKSGAGTWALSGTNTYSGGTTLSGGTISAGNAASFGTGSVAITGTSRINTSGGNISYANAINVGAALTLQNPNPTASSSTTATFTGILSGSSAISLPNSGVNAGIGILAFTNAANTFTGNVILSASGSGDEFFSFSSLGDAGNFTFAKNGNRQGITYTGSSNIVFNTRQIALATTFSGGATNGLDGGGVNPIMQFQSNGTGTVTFNSNMAMTTITTSGTLFFDGTNTGNNTFAGIIGNPTNLNLNIGKYGVGTWVFSGANTYAGNTIIANGILSVNAISNAANAQPLGKGPVIQFGVGNSSNSGSLSFTGGTSSTDKQVQIGGPVTTAGATGAGSILNNGTGALTFASATFNPTITGVIASRTLTLGGSYSGSAPNTIQGTIQNNSLAGQVALTVSGSAWNLSGANTYTGATTLTGGTLGLANQNALRTTGLTMNGGTLAFDQSVTGNAFTLGGLSAASAGAGFNIALQNNAVSPAAVALSVGNSNTSTSYAGVLSGPGSLVKIGSGVLTLTGTHTYTGGTVVNGGTLLLSGAVNLPATGALQVNVGGNFSLADGTTRTTTTAGLTLSNGSLLTFDWVAGATDTLTSTSAATTSGAVAILFNPLSSPSGSGLTLISSPSGGLSGATFTLANQTNYSAVLARTDTDVTIGSYAAATPLTSAYWLGSQITGASAAMALSTGSVSNWASDAAGTSANGLVPGSTTDVFFSTSSGATQQSAVVLGSNMTVNSLTFNDTTPVTIGADGRFLTLNSTGTGALSAISVNQSATINAPLILGASQTWTVASGMSLSVGGAVSGGFGLTKADSGNLTLTGVNTYSGNTVISAGELAIGGAGQLGGGTYSGTISNAGSLAFGSSSAQTLSGVISGPGALNKSGAGTLTLSAANTFSGATTISSGTLRMANTAALGAGTAALDGTTISSGATLDLGGTTGTTGTERITVSGSGVGGNGAIVSSTQIASPFFGVRHVTLAADATLGFANRWDVGDLTAGGIDTLVTNGFTLNFLGTSAAAQASLNFLGVTDFGDINVNLGNVAATNILYLQGDTTLGDPLKTVSITGGSSLQVFSSSTVANFNKKFALDNGAITIARTASLDGTISLANTNTITASSATTATNVISGSGNLIKAGASSLTLTNANTYSGTTTISAGTLQLGDGTTGRDGSVDASSGIINNGTLIFNRFDSLSSSVPISGTGAVTKSGTGTQTLTGNNSYAGTTTVSAGTLVLAGNNSATSGATNLSGGTLVAANVNALNSTGLVAISTATAAGTLRLATDTSVTAFQVSASSSFPGTIISDRATSGPGITHALSTFFLGSNTYTVEAGGNVSGGTAAVSFSSVNLASGTAGTATLNPTSGTVLVTGPVNIGANSFAKTLVLGGSSTGNAISGVISNGVNILTLTKSGISTWSLAGANTHTGPTSITGGILNLANQNALATTAVTMNGGALEFDQSVAGNAFTLGSLAAAGAGAGFNITLANNAGSPAAVALTVGGNNTSTSYAGVLSGSGSLTKTGSGVLTLSGNSFYTGATVVNGGTLLLSGPVNPGAGTLQVNSGATFSLADGSASASTTAASLVLNNGSILTFDWVGGVTDTLTSTTAATTTGAVSININPLSSPSGSGLTLISSPSGGLSGASYILANQVNYTATLSQTDTAVTIGSYAAAMPLTSAFWLGGQVTGALGAMALSSGTTSNWASDAAGTSAGGLVPGSTSNVIFSTTSGATQQSAVVLGSNMTVSSVTFNDTTPVTIAADGMALTLNSTGTGASSAISANQSATINAGLVLGAAQTWTVASATNLVVGGAVSGGFGLTKSGAGTLTLGGANTYAGNTTVGAGILSVTGSLSGAVAGSRFLVNGGSLAFNTAGTANYYADGFANAAEIGVGAATGAVTLQSGTVNVLTRTGGTFGSINLGVGNAVSNGTLTVNGGTLNVEGRILMAANGAAGTQATLTIAGGQVNLGKSGSYINGTNDPGSGVLWFGAFNSTVNLNGGTLSLFGLRSTAPSGTQGSFNFNGGTLKSVATNTTDFFVLNTGMPAVVKSGGAIIDTNTFNNTIPTVLTHDSVLGATADGGLTKLNTGTLTLSGLNTFTGNVTVSGGVLAAGVAGSAGNSAFGSVVSTRTINVNSGGTLRFDVGNVFNNNFASASTSLPVLNIAGGTVTNGGTATNSALGNLTITGGTLTATLGSASGYGSWNLNGTVTSTGSSLISTTASVPITLSAAAGTNTLFDVQSGTLTTSAALGQVTATGDTRVSSLTKTGTGTMILSGANTYSGGTTVNNGTLTLGSATGLGTGAASVTGGSLDLGGQTTTNAVSIGASGTLTGAGSTGAATLAGTITPGGSGSGLITMASATVGSTSSIALQLANVGTRGVNYDALTVVSGGLALDGTITVTLNGLTPASGQSFDLIDFTGSIDLTNFTVATDLILPSLGGGLSWDTSTFASTGVVSIVTGGDPYSAWATLTGATGGKGGDTDGDGVINLLEFATNSNPTNGSSGARVYSKMHSLGGDNVLTYTIASRKTATFAANGSKQEATKDLVKYTVEASNELTGWTSVVVSEVTGGDATAVRAAITPALPTLDTDWEWHTFRTDGGTSIDPSDFIRLKVAEAP